MRSIRPRPFRSPGIALLAVLAMAIGIGSLSATVVLARGLLPSLPVEEAHRVVQVARTVQSVPGAHFSLRGEDVQAIRDRIAGLEAVGAFRRYPAHVTGPGAPPARVRAADVSSGVFPALGVDPVVGRWLGPEDEEPQAELMPPGFAFPVLEDLWLPLALDPSGVAGESPARLTGIGRLEDGATVKSVRAELSGLATGRQDMGLLDAPRGMTPGRLLPFL